MPNAHARRLSIGVLLLSGLTLLAAMPLGLRAQSGGDDRLNLVLSPTSSVYLPLAAQGAAPGPTSAALREVARRYGVSAELLQIQNQAEVRYALTGMSATEYKVLNRATGELYGIALDAAGAPVDSQALAAAERAASTARYGRLDPALAALLAADPAARVPVIIWLAEDAADGPVRPDASSAAGPAAFDQAAFLARADSARDAAVAALAAPVLGRLAAMGVGARQAAGAPVVYATLGPAALAEVNTWGAVDRIYLDHANSADLAVARQTIYAHVVNSRGLTGAGVPLALIEVGGRVAANPLLVDTVQDAQDVCATPSAHSTGVAGIMRGRSAAAGQRGVAFAAELYAAGSCDGISSQLQSASARAAAWGARALNLSWGANIGLVPGANDRFYDDLVLNRMRSVVKSAGNQGASSGNVTSPGLGYNVITVGSFSDRGSFPALADDRMSSFSSWRDPTSLRGDREEPDLAAPGEAIDGALVGPPWFGGIGSGTSFAAPMVAGGAALLIQRNPALGIWPEAIRAILQATAAHNLEGAGRLSERDGAGGIYLDYADDVARGARGGWRGLSYSCASPGVTTLASFTLAANQRLRAVIAWGQNPAFADYASRPSADLDLQLLRGASVVASSDSFDNNYEIIDYRPAGAGTFTLRALKFHCDLSPRSLGFAWFR